MEPGDGGGASDSPGGGGQRLFSGDSPVPQSGAGPAGGRGSGTGVATPGGIGTAQCAADGGRCADAAGKARRAGQTFLDFGRYTGRRAAPGGLAGRKSFLPHRKKAEIRQLGTKIETGTS